MIRKFFPLVLAALLTACWTADAPLIPDGEADSPKIAGKYTSETADSSTPVTSSVEIKAVPGGYFSYQAISDGGVATHRRVRLDQLQGDWYLAESQTALAEGGHEKPYYRILKVTKRLIEEYDPSCDTTDHRTDQVSVSSGTCTFSTYEALKALAKTRIAESLSGNPISLKLAASSRRE